MHIVFVTTEIAIKKGYSGGLSTFTANIAELFASKGDEVEILHVTTKDETDEYDCNAKVVNLYIDKRDWDTFNDISKIYCACEEADANRKELVSISKARIVRDYIRYLDSRNKIDIVHFCNHGSLSIMMDDSIPYVIRVSGLLNICMGGANKKNGSLKFSENPPGAEDRLEFYAMKRACGVFAPSKLVAGILRENVGIEADILETPFIKKKCCVQEGKYEFLKDVKYVLFFGTLKYLKGIQVVADIVFDMLSRNKDICLVMAGEDRPLQDDAGREAMASDYVRQKAGGYAERVIYLGQLNRYEMDSVIKNAEICLLPSRIENLSNACIESMSHGKIVIATDGASFEQLIDDGRNGFLCERDSGVSFLEKINYALRLSEKEKAEMSSCALKTIDRLNPDTIYEKYRSYYEKVICGFQKQK